MPKPWKKNARTGFGSYGDRFIQKKIHSGWFKDYFLRMSNGAVIVLSKDYKSNNLVWIVKIGPTIDDRRSFSSEKQLRDYMVVAGIVETSRVEI